MRIVEPSATIEAYTPDLEKVIERAGRTCYKSEDRITDESAERFIQERCVDQHESVLEHGAITVRFVVDRGVSHELVRHRLAAFSQESTRYCNYGKGKFNQEITVVQPSFWSPNGTPFAVWEQAMLQAERAYLQLLAEGCSPQQARSVLPNSLKTEVVVTANPREWRHIFKMRCDPAAHPQMRQVMVPLAVEFGQRWPSIFGKPEQE